MVADVLDDAGLLDDDRQPAILAWFTISTASLPALMRDEPTEWLQEMRHGSTSPPRRKPRADSTISTHLRWALPTLQQWATRHVV
ncbi:hypothetical protein [Micromonospora radicis]|uniref:Uncharacterized protein n=1 Tax=Micromonospora radicis TaxID=1894971 RepID=A0A418MN12_9ACTN|nr:hypothetical protein [Micromonospora radicis]RIV31330.1 hypothetical protein D2L64_25785 [Micromonospora radicis]